MSDTDHGACGRPGGADGRGLGDESGIIVFGGGSGGRGCSARGCLFWILLSVFLSVGLTLLVNIVLWLFSGTPPGIPVVHV
jgi:hypothetical protein